MYHWFIAYSTSIIFIYLSKFKISPGDIFFYICYNENSEKVFTYQCRRMFVAILDLANFIV